MAERVDVPHTTYRMGYAEGYRAGRIAALREVGCLWTKGEWVDCAGPVKTTKAFQCRCCRLLAEAESGEDTGEVGDDR